jgi:transglutaminase-like putative cysteine protease
VPFEIAREREYGNRMIHVGVDDPAADLVVQWTATITRTGDVGQGKGRVSERFLQADSLVPLEGEAAAMANELGLDDRDVPLVERARKAYDTVLTTMQYDKTAEGWGRGDFARACTVGKGNCTDFHAKFQGIARAGGIPVRFTMGVPLSSAPEGVAGGYHCWAHWHDGKRWRPVDISEAQKILAKDPAKAEWFFGHLDPDRVALTVGRDLTLAPPQAGKPLIFFAYPHVEVDGVEVQDPNAKEHRSLAWKHSRSASPPSRSALPSSRPALAPPRLTSTPSSGSS